MSSSWRHHLKGISERLMTSGYWRSRQKGTWKKYPQELRLGPAWVLHQSQSEKEVWHFPNINILWHLISIPMDLYKNLKQQISQRVRLNLVRGWQFQSQLTLLLISYGPVTRPACHHLGSLTSKPYKLRVTVHFTHAMFTCTRNSQGTYMR